MKVIKCVSENLTSVVVGGRASVQYILNKKVYAPEWLLTHGYGCLVFRDLKTAKECARKYCWCCKFYYAEVNKKEKCPLPPMLLISYLDEGEIKSDIGVWSAWPDGTLMFKGVTLNKEVLW